jgi:alginate O-acetyltransferase complex protein AlgI
MLFNSISYFIFFPVVIISYFNIPKTYRVFLLLVASCLFYMAFVPIYILILFAIITIDYFLALKMYSSVSTERKVYFLISIFSNIGLLFFFKYWNFAMENLMHLATFIGWNYSLPLLAFALPLGLSFHVFQSLSYVIEVYKGKYVPESSYLHYALYVMFFPQLVAGPIERPAHLLPQFRALLDFNPISARKGFERILCGLFKKVVIADQISVVVNQLYVHIPTETTGILALIILFSIQLYCDFSGYCDIAIGSAKVLGFELTENFNRPFIALSVADFWRRWHISLSSWLRDYVYYPLVFSWGKLSKWSLHASVIITFALIGLWHGANWTFITMGLLHGLYLTIGSLTENWQKKLKLPNFIHVSIVFILVSISFVFFRSPDMHTALTILGNLLHPTFGLSSMKGLGLFHSPRIIIVPSIILLFFVEYLQSAKNSFYFMDGYARAHRYTWYYALVFLILSFGYFGEQAFIYFKF